MLNSLLHRAAARVRSDRDAGVSLIELTIAMVVALIVLGSASTFFINMLGRSSAATVTTTNADQARITLDSWAGLLAVADSPSTPGSASGRIVSLDRTKLVFNANLGNRSGTQPRGATTLVTLSMTLNGQLSETRGTSTRYIAGCLTNSTSSTTGCLTPGQLGATTTLFTAYSSCASGLCAMSWPISSLTSVVAVGITFSMIDPHGGAAQNFSAIASLPAVSA